MFFAPVPTATVSVVKNDSKTVPQVKTPLVRDNSSNITQQILDSFNTFLTGLSTSAIAAENAEARRVTDFNAEQARLNREFQAKSASDAMEFEREQAEINRLWQEQQNQKSMEFSERLANSTYQRAVEDLKKAGLSPLLAYGNFQTSSPSGVTSSGSSARGFSSSGSSASGVKADSSSAKNADVNGLVNTFSSLASSFNLLVTGLTSAFKLL